MQAVRATLRFGLALAALMGTAAATRAHADPVTWDRLCPAVGNFAGLLAAYRNQGTPQSVAVAIARGFFSNGPAEILDHAVGDEIARQVYATPTLSPEQESASLQAKCLTPAAGPEPKGSTKAAVSGHAVTHLVSIPLEKGVNRIAPATVAGGVVEIVLGWRDDGDGRGHDAFTVKAPGQSDPSKAVTIADDLHDGDDALSSVRFAHGDVDGQPAVLLLTATRALPATKSVPTATVFAIYRLVPGEPGVGPPAGFELLERRTLAGRFCNADRALSEATALPLRRSYRGPRDAEGRFTANGCPEPMATRSAWH